MTRSERRLFRDTVIIGLVLTVTIGVLDLGDAFVAPERFFYDFRARRFQFFTPPPTDKLVHLDIDDPALELIGQYPWPRADVAEMVDEVRMAGAKALAFDVIYAERSKMAFKEIDPLPDTSQPTTLPATLDADPAAEQAPHSDSASKNPPPPHPSTLPATQPVNQVVRTIRVDNDAIFAESLEKFGKVVVPVALNLSQLPPESPSYAKMVAILEREPELISDSDPESSKEVMLRRLREQGHAENGLPGAVSRYLLPAAETAMFNRIEREFANGKVTFAELRTRTLPHVDQTLSSSALLNRLRKQYERYLAIDALRQFSRPYDPSFALLEAFGEQATIREFTQASGLTGFVDYVPMADGIVRTVPLWALHRGRVYPQIGLSMACIMLGVDVQKIQITARSIILPCADGRRIEVPVRYHTTPRGTFASFFDIPWFGKSGINTWRTMYDYPDQEQPVQRMSMTRIWDICLTRKAIEKNNLQAVRAAGSLAPELGGAEAKAIGAALAKAQGTDLTHPDALNEVIDLVLKYVSEALWDELDDFKTPRLQDIKDLKTRDMVFHHRALKQVRQQNAGLQNDLLRKRANLRRDLGGKACIVGYVAVGAIADTIPTSLHPRCPGVAVHGIIFNSIMTGDFWRTRGPWVAIFFSLLVGVMTTAVVATFPAWKALVATALIVTGYLLFNGLYLFDLKNQIVSVSGPVFAGLAVWAGGTLSRYILETAERRRVTARFSSYADKALVDYVLNNPEEKLDGKIQELSVVFTDLQGFTTISEALGPATVPLLNEYMGLMVPIIRNQNGYINKFLGDGIMYFFGAPLPNAKHAYNAIISVLEMQEAMVPFNESLTKRDLPNLVLRAGITTGEMVVGDAGPPERSDYTVIGDTVNLSARLEGANKAVGTRILLNDRCHQIVADAFLCRPIAKLQVKGKTQGVMTFEAMALVEKATDEQRALSRITADVVHPFCERDFEECLKVLGIMEATYGLSKFTYLYREECNRLLKEPPPPGWSGEIELKEK